MRPTNESPLGDVIKEMFRRYDLEEGVLAARAEEAWFTVVPAAFKNRTSTVRFSDGVIRITIDSAVVRNEILLSKNEWIERLNQEIGQVLIKDILLF